MPFLETPDAKIFYSYKKGKKETLVFVHGWMGNSTFWKNVATVFKRQGYGVLVFDLRGHGKSGKPKNPKKYTLDYFARDLAKLIRKLGIKNPVIIGHSLGGMIAVKFAQLYPAKARKLILLNTAARNPTKFQFILRKLELEGVAGLLSKESAKRKQLRALKKVDYTDYTSWSSFLLWMKGVQGTPTHAIFASMHEIIKMDISEALPGIKIPVLLLGGALDTTIPVKAMQEMHKKINNSQIHIFSGATHLMALKKPKDVSEKMLAFLKF